MAVNNDAESAIYNRLTTAPTFKPSGVKLFAPDWTLEPGDVVTVQSDGVNYPVPIYSMNLEWRNATKVDIQSSGSQKREPLSPLRRMEYRSGRRGYGAVQQAEEMQKQYEHFVEDTDAYRLEIYKINGVEFDPETGKVVYELVYQTDPVTGEPIIDPVTGEKVPVIDPATGEPMIKTDNAGNPIPVYNEESDGSIASQVIRSAQQISQKVTQADVDRSLTGYMQTTAWESRMGNYLETKDGTKVMKSIAEVVTMINNQSEGIVNISGDRVNINANKSATVGNTLYISDGGSFWVKRAAMFGSDTGSAAGKYVTINGGTVNAPNLQVNSGGTLTFSPSSQSDSALTLNRASFAGLVTDVQISGPVNNVYKLQYKKMGTGDSWKDAQVSFSRATTLYKSNYTIDGTNKTAGWSSGTFTVKAEPQGESTSTRLTGIEQSGNITKSSTLPKYVNFPYVINYADDNDNELDTGFRGAGTGNPIATVSVDASLVYTDGQDHMTANGSWGTYNAQDTAENKAKNSFTYQAYTTDNPSIAKGTAKQTDVTLSSGLWIGNKKTVYLKENNNILAEFEVDASSLVPSTTSGTITDIILNSDNKVSYDSTSEILTVNLKATGTNVTNSPYSDSVQLSVSSTALSLTKGNLGNTSTDSFDNVYKGRYNISRSSGGIFKIENTNTLTASVTSLALNLELAVPVCSLTTAGLTEWDSTNHQYVYDLTASLTVDSTGNTLKRQVKGLTLTPTDAINYGKTLVGIDTITLGTITANSSARTATVSATVILDNGVTKTSDVDVSTIYQAGLDGGPEITSAPFVVKLVDNNNVFIKNRQKTVNVSAIYQKGVDDAAPPVTVYFIYRETGVLTNAYSAAKTLPSKSDIIGQLYPNTIINFIRYYTATDGILSVQYVECEYYGMTFYVMAQNVHTGTTPDSPTNYPNMTGWYSGQAVTYDYTGVVSFDTGNYVNIYSSQSTSSSSVTTVPNEASVQCMHNPNGYSGEWMPVKYGNYTGYMEAKYIYGTQAWNDAHPSVPVLQAIDIQWIVHSTSSYTESVTMLVDTTKDSATTKTCDYVPASAYNAITTDSSADVSQYLEYVYRYAYLSYVQTAGMPDQITAKIRLKLTYSGTDTPTYLNLELNSVGQIVYRYTSTVYAETGSTVRMRSGPGTSYSTVTNVPIGSTIYCFENPNGYPKQNEWMRVKYGQYEGYMMSKFIVGTGAYEEEFGGGGDDPNDIATVQITGVAHQAQYFNGRFSITIQPSYPNENGTYANSATSSVPTNYSTFGNNADDTAGMGAYFSTVWSSYYATNNTQSEMGPSDTECEHKMVVRVTLKNGDSYTRLITFKSKYR